MTNVFTGFLMSNVYIQFLLYLKTKIEMACCIKIILLEKLIIKEMIKHPIVQVLILGLFKETTDMDGTLHTDL